MEVHSAHRRAWRRRIAWCRTGSVLADRVRRRGVARLPRTGDGGAWLTSPRRGCPRQPGTGRGGDRCPGGWSGNRRGREKKDGFWVVSTPAERRRRQTCDRLPGTGRRLRFTLHVEWTQSYVFVLASRKRFKLKLIFSQAHAFKLIRHLYILVPDVGLKSRGYSTCRCYSSRHL